MPRQQFQSPIAFGRFQSLSIWVFASLFLLPLSADAKTLYVDGANGNDAVSYANNGPATPWRTIGRAAWGSTNRSSPNAAEAARAGDIVRVAAGTYVTTGTNARFEPAYNPANSGTAGSPIRFEGIGTVVLTFSSGSGPMIGAYIKDYIEWSGFTISEATAPTRSDTGPVTFLAATGGAIESSILVGNPSWTGRVGDNYPGVRLEDASGVRVANNVIRDYGGQTGDENHNGIETYRSYPVTIENNHIVNCGAGIYMKAVNTDTLSVDTVVIRYNIFEANRYGIRIMRMPMTQGRPMLIYQNLFFANTAGGSWTNVFDNGPTDPTWIRFVNNTFVNNGNGIVSYNFQTWKPNSRHLYANNIVAGSGTRVRQDTVDVALNNTKDRQDYDRNLYAPGTFGDLGGSSWTFAQWQGLGQDANGLVADPQFVSGTDFHLASTSPARTLGRAVHGIGGPDGTIVPAGAYITGQEVIGPSISYTGPTLPTAPRNLRIITP